MNKRFKNTHWLILALLIAEILPSCSPIASSTEAIKGVTPIVSQASYVTLTSPATRIPVTPVLAKEFIDEHQVQMILIPAGEFQMGNESGYAREQPVHSILLDNFYIDVYEVTNLHYEDCEKAGVCSAPGDLGSFNRDSYYRNSAFADYPVIYLNWEQASTFCTWRGARLPTEAEWEKAARGGLEGMEFPWGNELPVCQRDAENGALFDDGLDCTNQDTVEVGSYSPNGYGLYDLAGNVWEWVMDLFLETYYSISPLENPLGPAIGEFRVLRGGAWYGDPDSLRVSDRFHLNPDDQLNNVGFRCARSVSSFIATPIPSP